MSLLLRSPTLLARRTFFASSTDHTRLLAESEVHRLAASASSDNGTLYVLVAGGTEPDLVTKVPQLHLARLSVKDQTLFGAKVITRTLGAPAEVCGKLVDAALDDIGGQAQARSVLHGLCDWVQKKKDLGDMQPVVEAIATGNANQATYEQGREAWGQLATDYIHQGLAAEAVLYQSKGAKLVEIEHGVDKSAYADTSAGAMALFRF